MAFSINRSTVIRGALAAGAVVIMLAAILLLIVGATASDELPELAFGEVASGCVEVESRRLGVVARVTQEHESDLVFEVRSRRGNRPLYAYTFDEGSCETAAIAFGTADDIWVSPGDERLIHMSQGDDGAWQMVTAAEATRHLLPPIPPEMVTRLSPAAQVRIGVIE